MSSGAKQVLYIVPETAVGTVPASPKWATLPFKSVSLDGAPNKTESDTVADGRIGRGGFITGLEIGGDIEANAAFGTYDALLEAAFFKDWTADALSVGETRKTFSAVRGYRDIGNYHTFNGLHVAKFALDIPEEGLVTFKFTMAGLARSQANAAPAGTIAAAALAEEFTNVGVGEITLDGTVLRGVACVTAFSFELDNGMKAQKCLGGGLSVGKQLEGRTTIGGSFTVAWSQKSAEIYEKQFANAKLALLIPFGDAAGNKYELSLPAVTVKGSLPSGGADDLLSTQFEYTVQDASPVLRRIAKP